MSHGTAAPPMSGAGRASSGTAVDIRGLAGLPPFSPLSCSPLGWGGSDRDPSASVCAMPQARRSACKGPVQTSALRISLTFLLKLTPNGRELEGRQVHLATTREVLRAPHSARD